MLSGTPGKVNWPALASGALLMKVNLFCEVCVPFPLKTMVIPRFGVTTIIPGLVPAEIGEIGRKMSFSASTIYTPASEVPALTLLEMKARYLRPLVLAPLGAALPQLSQVRVAGSRNNKKIGIRFKRRTPTSCRIITWMQEE